ncbi:MAG: nitroreductase family deazaflavin-dependent oxidoreductase [Acidobacteriota bacterium]|nr:nitroreductase family deazaflavin-dependent oxidoreductase [Acidobacteriota bacterium]
MGGSHRLVDTGFRALNSVHRGVVKVSNGRVGARAFGMEVVELVTVGRRTGRRHSTMLTAPIVEGERLVLVASKGGDDRDPDWLRNLVANPSIEVIRRGALRKMTARLATPEECDELWPRVIGRYRFYDTYRRRAARTIPLVICEPG